MSSIPPPPGGGDQPPYDSNQGYGQQGYGQQGGYGQAPPPGGYGGQPSGGGSGSETNGMAITSLVLGVLGLPLLCCWIGGLLSIAAVITGHLGKKKSDESHGRVGQRGLAQAGFILGIIGTVIFLALIVWLIYVIATGGEFNYQYGTDFGETE